MTYIAITLNHVRAVKAWAETHGGQANLDLLTFELEVKARHRFFTLYPQFLVMMGGKFAYVPQITPDASGFIGWLPYRALRWPLSTDKQVFKRLLTQNGVRTPDSWTSPSEARCDYIVKQSTGSFGFDMAGPFRQGEVPTDALAAFGARAQTRGNVFAEQFVRGRNLKVWFWGDQAFHVQLHTYPLIVGDGQSTIRQLATDLLGRSGVALETYKEMSFLVQALAYQGSHLGEVLQQGKERWLDFRYGRRFCPQESTAETDNALGRLGAPQRRQIDTAGRLIAGELARTLQAPVLCAVDGVLDDAGDIWWLEVNSNPIFVPTGYPLMLDTLFGTAAGPSARTAKTSSASATHV